MMNVRISNQEKVTKRKAWSHAPVHARVRGFTLVELLVTMGIFITVITIATGALFSAQAINVKLEQTQIILDEVNLSTEVMVRDIRYGAVFNCSNTIPGSSAPLTRQSCAYPDAGTVLSFRPATILNGSTYQVDDRVVYYVSDGVLYKKEYPSGGTVTTSRLTSSTVNINTLTFFTSGVISKSDNDFSQPLVTVIISGVTVPPRSNVPPVSFSVQTSASSREIDN